MLIAWISMDFREPRVISMAFSNVYIPWPFPTAGEVNRRKKITWLSLRNEGPSRVMEKFLEGAEFLKLSRIFCLFPSYPSIMPGGKRGWRAPRRTWSRMRQRKRAQFILIHHGWCSCHNPSLNSIRMTAQWKWERCGVQQFNHRAGFW